MNRQVNRNQSFGRNCSLHRQGLRAKRTRYIIFSPIKLWEHSVVSIITYCVEIILFIRGGLKVLKLVKCSLALDFDVFYVLQCIVLALLEIK